MHWMLQQLITSFTTRSADKATRLQPGELDELLESVPEVARKRRIRKLRNEPQPPRSVCTTLKDLCEF
jgi:hypothetical protein